MTDEIKAEFDKQYGKPISDYLVNMSLGQILNGDLNYLGENPAYLINLLIKANEYLLAKVE